MTHDDTKRPIWKQHAVKKQREMPPSRINTDTKELSVVLWGNATWYFSQLGPQQLSLEMLCGQNMPKDQKKSSLLSESAASWKHSSWWTSGLTQQRWSLARPMHFCDLSHRRKEMRLTSWCLLLRKTFLCLCWERTTRDRAGHVQLRKFASDVSALFTFLDLYISRNKGLKETPWSHNYGLSTHDKQMKGLNWEKPVEEREVNRNETGEAGITEWIQTLFVQHLSSAASRLVRHFNENQITFSLRKVKQCQCLVNSFKILRDQNIPPELHDFSFLAHLRFIILSKINVQSRDLAKRGRIIAGISPEETEIYISFIDAFPSILDKVSCLALR